MRKILQYKPQPAEAVCLSPQIPNVNQMRKKLMAKYNTKFLCKCQQHKLSSL